MTADDGSEDIVFIDLLFLTLLGFAVMVVMMIPHLNPPTVADETSSPGNIIIEMVWGEKLTSDIDLWVMAPDGVPIGYSNKNGKTFDLLRDDLGVTHDDTQLNYEFAYSRGAPSGEYVVNVHLYSQHSDVRPIPVVVNVSMRTGATGTVTRLVHKEVLLTKPREELTVVRFSVDDEGKFVRSSVHDFPKPIRGGGPT